MRSFLLAALALLASGCTTEATEATDVAEITVLGHLTPCTTFEALDCMLVDEGRGPEFFYDTIAGFTYRWGAMYRLEVDITRIRHPVPDGPSRELRLREVIDAHPVAPRSEFTLVLQGEAVPGLRPLLTPAGQGFAMPFGRRIACDDAAVCTAIGDALRRPGPFDLTLRHPETPTDEQAPLTAVAVTLR